MNTCTKERHQTIQVTIENMLLDAILTRSPLLSGIALLHARCDHSGEDGPEQAKIAADMISTGLRTLADEVETRFLKIFNDAKGGKP